MRTVFAKPHAERPLPRPEGDPPPEGLSLEAAAREESQRLMRVNHCGEVCAQALYQGQALVAKNGSVQALLKQAASEEYDHLAWCQARLHELGGTTSHLTPLFYAGSFGLGVVSGLLGDKWSMGFLVETEKQVESHLDAHLQRLAPGDRESRVILEAMREDEINHGRSGTQHGAVELPSPVRAVMRGFSKVMTGTTYWV